MVQQKSFRFMLEPWKSEVTILTLFLINFLFRAFPHSLQIFKKRNFHRLLKSWQICEFEWFWYYDIFSKIIIFQEQKIKIKWELVFRRKVYLLIIKLNINSKNSNLPPLITANLGYFPSWKSSHLEFRWIKPKLTM